MSKSKTKPDKWIVNFNYSIYDDLLNGEALVLYYDKEKKQIVSQNIIEYLKINKT